MAGVVLRALGRKTFDFSGIGANQSQDFIAGEPIDVSRFTQGELIVRIHRLETVLATGAHIKVRVLTAAQTEEDPGMLFAIDSPAAEVDIDSSYALVTGQMGTVIKAALSSNFGASVVVVVIGQQPTTPGTIKATISADLVLKE